MNLDVTGIVLAGGRSTRFGADKLVAEIDGRTVLDRSVDAVASISAEVIVVGGASARSDVRSVDDPEPFGGPLQALAGALASTGTQLAIVVAGDMPSVVPAVIQLLVAELRCSSNVDAVILADPDEPPRLQPLPLALRVVQARAAAAAALGAGDRSLVRFLGRVGVAEVTPERWLPLDPEGRSLLDIDVPADLRRARDVASDQRNR